MEGPFTVLNNPLQSFLGKFRAERGSVYNFTSIAKPLGSYYVPPEHIDRFYQIYVNLIDKHGIMPFLTEKPGLNSPILIDLDFKFELGSVERRYEPDFVRTIVAEYFKFLSQYIVLDDTNAKCFVFERPAPYATAKEVKDGLHMMFPFITAASPLKLLARQHVLQACGDLLTDLGTTNPITDIVDRAVIDRNNWFVYGAGKPGCLPYQLTSVIDADGADVPFELDNSVLVPLLSVKGTSMPNITFLDGMEDELDEAYQQYLAAQNQAKLKPAAPVGEAESSSAAEQTRARAARKSKFEQCDNLDFVSKLVTILNKERANEYFQWMQVGWALHNIDDSLLGAWIEFSKASPKFEAGECERRWVNMRDEGLGIGSIVRWAKQDNHDEYEVLRRQDIRSLLEKSAAVGGAHHAVARVLYGMYRYQFVCLSRKFKSWIEYRGHRWHRTEEGYGLLIKISNELYQEYTKISNDYAFRVANTSETDEKERLEKKRTAFNKIATQLLNTAYKTCLMKEAYELFYVDGFEDQLDANVSLMGFENGVYDFDKQDFRDGRPEDCITLTTGIDYMPYDENDSLIRKVENVIAKIHPATDVRDYIYKLLASFLSGAIKHQRFHIWTGTGCHALDSPILMWGGEVKKVQDIGIGERLMGDDGTPREVLRLWRGREEMFKITPVKGEAFVVNRGHRLALKATNTITVAKADHRGYTAIWQVPDPILVVDRRRKNFFIRDYGTAEAAKAAAEAWRTQLHANEDVIRRGDVITVPIYWYLENRKRIGERFYMLYRAASEYEEKATAIDPWFLGFWLGDGNRANQNITTADPEVVEEVRRIAGGYGLQIKEMVRHHFSITSTEPIQGQWKRNYLLDELRKCGVITGSYNGCYGGAPIDSKHVPMLYKCNSREVRLKVLAGIIDSDGYYQKTSQQYEVTLKNEKLLDDVIFLARSLGYAAYKFPVKKTCTNGKNGPVTGDYFRTQIFGQGLEKIPSILARKKADGLRTTKRSALVTNFKIESVGEGDYYGFEVDCNNLYLDATHTVIPNSNGKSMLIDIYSHGLGSYAGVLPISLLTQKRGASNAASPELARVKGKRFCVLQEPEDDVRLNVGLMKELTGGDRIIARALFEAPVEFKPQFKMVLTCNRLPDIPSNDGGTWRRIRVVEFTSKFCMDPDPEDPRQFAMDTDLQAQLPALGKALMSVLIKYWGKVQREGIQEPESVTRYTAEYQRRCDKYMEFCVVHVVVTEDKRDIVRLSEVYALFKEWYKQNESDLGRLPNSKELREYIDTKVLKSNNHLWKGMRLRAIGEEEFESDDDDNPGASSSAS